MERLPGFPACTFRRLWKAWGARGNRSESTSFMNVHPIEIRPDFSTLPAVRATLRRRPVGTDAGRVLRPAAPPPPVEACGGIGLRREGQERPYDVCGGH